MKKSDPVWCAFPGCNMIGTTLARGRDEGFDKVAKYCESHAEQVAEQGGPEYRECCPACGCLFGIN